MVVHQSDDTLLLDYASGALNEPLSLAMATHLSLSMKHASQYQALNQVGGVMLQEIECDALDDDDDMGLSAVLDRLDDEPVKGRPVSFSSVTTDIIPAPLRDYLPADLDALKWRKVGPGVEEFRIKTGTRTGKTSLLRIQPGRSMPEHTHAGREITVVLDGSYNDGAETFARGDLQVADDDANHQPVAHDEDGCICLVALDAPVRFTGPVGRLLNPFIRF
jgi:putative transcriptional regulator